MAAGGAETAFGGRTGRLCGTGGDADADTTGGRPVFWVGAGDTCCDCTTGPGADTGALSGGSTAGVVDGATVAAGTGVAEALGALPGVRRVTPAPAADGRIAVTLTADGSRDLRPEIFALAQARGWTLYELHRQAGTLEDLFHQLTQAGA